MTWRKVTIAVAADAADKNVASVAVRSQQRPATLRYLLRVDRQTKSSFDSLDQAEQAGRRIKDAFPVVQVSIYDTAMSESTVLSPSLAPS